MVSIDPESNARKQELNIEIPLSREISRDTKSTVPSKYVIAVIIKNIYEFRLQKDSAFHWYFFNHYSTV